MPSKYIEFVDRDSEIDFDSEMKRIQAEFAEVLRDEEQSREELLKAFEGLGYGIDD